MSRSMYTGQQGNPSRLREGASCTDRESCQTSERALLCGQRVVCSLPCPFCYWQHAVSGMLWPEGFWSLYWDEGSGLSLWSLLSQFLWLKINCADFSLWTESLKAMPCSGTVSLPEKFFSIYQCHLDQFTLRWCLQQPAFLSDHVDQGPQCQICTWAISSFGVNQDIMVV